MLGVFWKVQEICYVMGTEIFKIEEEMNEKMKPKVANPPSKNGQNSLLTLWGCSQMTSAFFGVSDTPWCLCQPIISFWPAPWCFKLTMSALNQKRSFLESSLFPPELSESVLQKGSSWALWDPLRPVLDEFPQIVGFFIIHHLFWWPLVPPRQLSSAF